VRAIDLALDRKIKQEARKLAQAEQAAFLASAKGDKGEPGPQGPKGDKGDKGDKPRHQWNGTLLRFEQADGSWGKFVDLQGPKGARGPRGTGGGSAAGGGDVSYIRDTPMTISLGGAVAGTTFDGTLADALDKLLYPYAAPAFSSFAVSGYSTVEVGAEIAGPLTFTWGTSYPDNITPDSISISNTSDAVLLVENSANDGSETVTLPAPLVLTAAGSKSFQISGGNSAGETFTRSTSISWAWRIYYGESEDTSLDTEIEIEALRASLLASSASRTYSFLGGGYKWLAYPVAMGLRTTFTDPATGFPVAMEVPITVSLTNQYGVATNYYVHRTYNPLASDIQIAVS
jgi:hypothetical protein